MGGLIDNTYAETTEVLTCRGTCITHNIAHLEEGNFRVEVWLW